MKRYILLIITFFLTPNLSIAQGDKEKALAKGNEAIKLMDNGQIEESIKLLEESINLDPENIDYPYEMGFAYYISKNYEKCIDILTDLKKRKDTNSQVFQLLGNSYDIIGKREKAIDTYEDGLKKLPKSGRLYLELGGMYLVTKEYDKAISYYEKGVDVEPNYPSNYYRLAKIFISSDEEVWGMIYGEIFMNLERNSARTTEISKMLYDTYTNEIKFTSDTSFSVSFSKNAIVDLSSGKAELPFGVGVYELTLMMEMLGEKSIDIHSLNRIRTRFINNYFQNNRDKKYPIVLFDFQYKVLKEGHFDAYNYWILMKGDENEFIKWKMENPEKWDKFLVWFNPNGLKIDERNKFNREEY